MSFDATAWAAKQTTGKTGAKVVLLALANYADKRGYCFPSQKLLSQFTELSVRSIRRCLDHLENQKLITREPRRREDGANTTNAFWLNFDQRPDCPAAKLTSGQIVRT